MNKFVIQWVNKFSGERGFVEKIDVKNSCFINARSRECVRIYVYKATAMVAFNKLCSMDVDGINDYLVIPEEEAVFEGVKWE